MTLPAISWTRWRDAVVLVVRGVTFRTASKIAVIVGTLLTAVNQGSVILAGDAELITWLRTAANYVIPYTVASLGYLAPFRQPRAGSESLRSVERSDQIADRGSRIGCRRQRQESNDPVAADNEVRSDQICRFVPRSVPTRR